MNQEKEEAGIPGRGKNSHESRQKRRDSVFGGSVWNYNKPKARKF